MKGFIIAIILIFSGGCSSHQSKNETFILKCEFTKSTINKGETSSKYSFAINLKEKNMLILLGWDENKEYRSKYPLLNKDGTPLITEGSTKFDIIFQSEEYIKAEKFFIKSKNSGKTNFNQSYLINRQDGEIIYKQINYYPDGEEKRRVLMKGSCQEIKPKKTLF